MSDEMDWVMRPVLRGMCSYESLLDGRVDLAAIGRMNEAIDVDIENQFRAREVADG